MFRRQRSRRIGDKVNSDSSNNAPKTDQQADRLTDTHWERREAVGKDYCLCIRSSCNRRRWSSGRR